jgi:hypothetical protein
MRGAIGYCRHCKAVFESNAIDFGNARDITFLGGIGVKCPKGHDPALLDGTFDFMEEGVRLVAGPEFTLAAQQE